MNLSNELVKKFAKEVKAVNNTKPTETTARIAGTIQSISDYVYVSLDGSEEGITTPAESLLNLTSDNIGDRVIVEIRDRNATIVGNYDDPSATSNDVNIVAEATATALSMARAAEGAAERAEISAGEAKTSADSAASAAEAADAKATQATIDAQIAKTAANEAKADAQAASTAAAEASSQARAASTAASAAQTSADNAATAAATADSKAQQAIADAGRAQTAASTAETSAAQAISDAAAANTAANNAGRAASIAQAAADAAQGDIDEQKQYFWHDSEGAHILSDDSGSRMDLTGDGLDVTDANGDSVAEFGADGSRIGKKTGARIESKSTSIEAYDENGEMYFEVSEDGMSWGSNIAATTAQVASVDTKATNAVNTAQSANQTAREASSQVAGAVSTAASADAKAQSVVDRANAGDFDGAKGDKGDPGEKGDKGDPGEQGIQGIPGEKGDKGDTGAQGIQGIPGEKGDKGDTGAQGIQGEKGDTGAQGIPGEKGDKGDTGETGAQGIPGEDGKSAYQSAIEGGMPSTTTEAQFNSDLADTPNKANTSYVDEVSDTANRAYEESIKKAIYYAYSENPDGSELSLANMELQYRGITSKEESKYEIADPQPTEDVWNEGIGWYIYDTTTNEYIEQIDEEFDEEQIYYVFIITQSINPSDYNWEINPVYAQKMATDFLEEVDIDDVPSAKLSSPNTKDAYFLLNALALSFYMDGILQAKFGYDGIFRSYGINLENVLIAGSGGGIRFDNLNTPSGRFIFEVRENGHLSLKLL